MPPLSRVLATVRLPPCRPQPRRAERWVGWDGAVRAVTSGGTIGTSGAGWHPRLVLGVIVAAGALQAVVNVQTELADHAQVGAPLRSWEAWCWELTSYAGFLAMLPLVLMAARRLIPPRLSWPAAIIAQVGALIAFSAGHVAVMAGLRHLVYALAGEPFAFLGDYPAQTLLYEFRKDAMTYLLLVAVLVLAHRLGSSATAVPAGNPGMPVDADKAGSVPPASDYRLIVRDGTRTHVLRPSDIELVEAAGNYVEVHTAQGPLLHRATLATMEEELAPQGFVRVHRSRLVRRVAIREIATTPAGDFTLTLDSGRSVAGSRRYRDRI